MPRVRETGFAAMGLAMLVGVSGCGGGTKGSSPGGGGNTSGDASAGGASPAGGSGGGVGKGGGGALGSGGGPSTGGRGSGGVNAGGGGARVDAGAGGTGGASTDAGAGGVGGSVLDAGAGGTGGALTDASVGGSNGDASQEGGGSAGASNSVIDLNVDVTGNAHPISRLIYGINAGGVACSNPSARFTLCRKGSNPWSTYNWENNASNAGDGRCFENNDALGATDTPGLAVTSLVDEAGAGASLVTVPIIDYVAADKIPSAGPPACLGDVRDTGSGYLDTRFRHNRSTKGSALSATPDTTDAYVNQDEFVSFLKGYAPTAQILFAMDNQPELWSQTHAEAHPAHATYAEVAARNIEYASMVRSVWPEAEITGGVGYGWQAFWNLQYAPDSTGRPDFITYYLAAMKQAEVNAGVRLIDYLDVHWYSEALGGASIRVTWPDTTPPDPGVVAARVQAPRSLWDGAYRELSWIASDLAGPIDLLHWLEQRIVSFYPGTKLAISGWSYGGDEHISGAIAAADALGIYGRESVGLAAAEPSTTDASFLIGAFAAYRNFDGAGAAFGDTSVSATTSDVARVSVYASTDSTVPDRTVLIVINRSAAPAETAITIQHATSFSAADVFQITDQSALPVAAAGLVATGANVFSFTPPAYSISVIVPKG